ncbi:alpha/beta family hydrolase [Salipiger pallidus]|nr:alpha/beta family hydrolase [Salipiger pallidus]
MPDPTTPPDFLMTPARGNAMGLTLLLGHGSGAAMDSGFMDAMANCIAGQGISVARFEFAYMAARRSGGPKRPPPRIDGLLDEYRAAIRALPTQGGLLIGGKSMGGRVASMILQDLYADGTVLGGVCLGYPFHPSGEPDKLRTDHLKDLSAPLLICQGSRDPLGTRDEVTGYGLAPKVALEWLEDGDHDLAPRERVTGLSQADHLAAAAAAIRAWAEGLAETRKAL